MKLAFWVRSAAASFLLNLDGLRIASGLIITVIGNVNSNKSLHLPGVSACWLEMRPEYGQEIGDNPHSRWNQRQNPRRPQTKSRLMRYYCYSAVREVMNMRRWTRD